MEIKRVSSRASSKGPAEWFTGSVRIDFKHPIRRLWRAQA